MSEENIKTEDTAKQASEPAMSKADHHKHLDEKYPTKRGFWDVVAKNGFLFLTHLLCAMTCTGTRVTPMAFLSSTISLRDISNICAASQLPTLRQTTANSAVSS